MERLFVDTNIVLDLLQNREDFFKDAQELFILADEGRVELYILFLELIKALIFVLSSKFTKF
ncbi:hypothetical protein GCM10008106_34620 [Mongoliitalea lutea]|uniref:PIN domain-containing protein n=1 Tax=Mongoliitalea lutea TaxID=849756 RepID=A0A8J3G6T8_9BACT|nr:hypothetical protein GCM10008106_34620 [Mongoliitalea lutea]